MKKAAVAIFAAVTLGAVFAAPVAAALIPGVLDQSNAAGTATIGSTADLAQTFTAGKTGLMTGVRLWLEHTDTMYVHLETTTGGKPDGNVIGVTTTETPSNTANWVLFEFYNGVPVVSGTTYAIVFNTNSSGADAAYGSADTYAGGQAFTNLGNWVSISADLQDFAFQTYVDQQTISLGWDKTQIVAGATTSLTLTETLVFPDFQGPPAVAQPAINSDTTWTVTSDTLPAWFTISTVGCSTQVALADCVAANVAPGQSMPIMPDGNPIVLTLTGTASPAAAGTASAKVESCAVYPILTVAAPGQARPAADSWSTCVSAEVSIAVVAPAATPDPATAAPATASPTIATTLPPTAVDGTTPTTGTGSIVWLLMACLSALVGGAVLLAVRRPIRNP